MNLSLPNQFRPFFWHFFRPYRWQLACCFLPMVYSAVTLSLEPYLLKILMDRISADPQDYSHVLRNHATTAFLFPLLATSIVIVWRLKDYLVRKILPAVKTQIIDQLFAYISQHSHKFFQDHVSGQVASKMREVQLSIEEIFEASLEGFRGLCLILISVTFMWSIHALLAGMLLFWTSLFIFLAWLLYKRTIPTSEKLSELKSSTFSKWLDSIANEVTVKFFGHRHFERKHLSTFLKQTELLDQRLRLELMITWAILGMVYVACEGFLIFSLLYLRSKNLVSLGDFAFVIWTSIGVLTDTWLVTEKLSKIPQNIGTCQDGLSLLLSPPEMVDLPQASPLELSQGHIDFEKVSFTHHGAINPLFQNLSVSIQAGTKVGLVGYSGSGKSTFIHLLLRLFEPNAGRILIDHQDISLVSQDSLRQQIGFIPQDPGLFHRSLRENIRYGNLSAPDEAVEAAAHSAHAHSFIVDTPLGYDSLAGERGVKLSGGQRQRIAVARAILKNAPLLILDEATSSLDSITESLIQDSLAHLMQGKTTIVIAHRLTTVLAMDRILVFDRGQIIEDGTHTELLAHKKLYWSLWNGQVDGFLPEAS